MAKNEALPWIKRLRTTFNYLSDTLVSENEAPRDSINSLCDLLGEVLTEPADSGLPYEYSFEMTRDSTELRFFLRPWGPDGDRSSPAAWREGSKLLRRLNYYGMAELNRINTVQDLFKPISNEALLGMCIAFAIRHDRILTKVYLDCNAAGIANNAEVAYQAMSRLELAESRDWLEEFYPLSSTSPARSFSLDLVDSPAARIKLYPHTGAESINNVLKRVVDIDETQSTNVLELFKGSGAPVEKAWDPVEQPTLCWNFTLPGKKPSDLNIYVPSNRHQEQLRLDVKPLEGLLPPPRKKAMRDFISDIPGSSGNSTVRNPFHWVARKVGNPLATTFYVSAQEAEQRSLNRDSKKV